MTLNVQIGYCPVSLKMLLKYGMDTKYGNSVETYRHFFFSFMRNIYIVFSQNSQNVKRKIPGSQIRRDVHSIQPMSPPCQRSRGVQYSPLTCTYRQLGGLCWILGSCHLYGGYSFRVFSGLTRCVYVSVYGITFVIRSWIFMNLERNVTHLFNISFYHL